MHKDRNSSPSLFSRGHRTNTEQNELGSELRRLRRERGLSQRALTKMLGLSAHSNIADYESGRRIPPLDIVSACDRLMQTNGTLREHHARALAQRARPDMPPPEKIWIILALFILLGGMVSAAATQAEQSAVWDGNDPKAAGCADDAITLDSQPVGVVGSVVLRYSRVCKAAWAKFEPATVEPATVSLETIRPADGMRTVFEYPRLEQTYGDILRTAPGCVQAKATVRFPDERLPIVGVTACMKSNPYRATKRA